MALQIVGFLWCRQMSHYDFSALLAFFKAKLWISTGALICINEVEWYAYQALFCAHAFSDVLRGIFYPQNLGSSKVEMTRK